MRLTEERPASEIELWGGIECTVNRVGNRFHDQLELSLHSLRADDIDRCAELGLKVLRYPLIWERVAPGDPTDADWSWADERMRRMQELGIEPIVGLLHHGSGPRHTSLLDPEFVPKFTTYARLVAERFPWIRKVTPINEPLTTARFSGLYGHWYPHGRSNEVFARAFLQQCLAIRTAVCVMREVIPDLALIQTEDVGRVYSTPSLEYQASFENERRWLTFDALCGRVNRDHPMWRYLAVDEWATNSLDDLVAAPCPPDVLGVNYYVTSDRFLDDRLHLYPPDCHGGNGRDRYADVEAVRARREGLAGHSALLSACWSRYNAPLAITEAHLGCTREQQLRWLMEAWNGATAARKSGCDVRAVTAWALFGSFGWDSLVTRKPFSYEPGAFDVRSTPPRKTAISRAVRALATERGFHHPAAEPPGWWHPAESIDDIPVDEHVPSVWHHGMRLHRRGHTPLLITGAGGTLGRALAKICCARGLPHVSLSRRELDVTDAILTSSAIASLSPWAVINAAGYVRVDDAERERQECYRVNAEGPVNLARVCAARRIPLVTFSTDLVFDGDHSSPYTEEDLVSPLNVYGESKAAAEAATLNAYPDALVVRTSAFFGPWDHSNFVIAALRTLADGAPFPAANDVSVSPTYVPDLAHAVLDLLIDGESGIWHLANRGEVTWAALAAEVAARARSDVELVRPVAMAELARPARVPRYSVLGSSRASLLPTLDNALDRFFAEALIPERQVAATW